MVWKASIHSGLSYLTSPLDRALNEFQRVAGTLRDHGQHPHDEQRVEGASPAQWTSGAAPSAANGFTIALRSAIVLGGSRPAWSSNALL